MILIARFVRVYGWIVQLGTRLLKVATARGYCLPFVAEASPRSLSHDTTESSTAGVALRRAATGRPDSRPQLGGYSAW